MIIPESRYRAVSHELMKYEELEIEVKQLCGYDFKCLKELFAMGFTLQPPEYELSLSQITRLHSLKGE